MSHIPSKLWIIMTILVIQITTVTATPAQGQSTKDLLKIVAPIMTVVILGTVITIYLVRRNHRKAATEAKALEDSNQNAIITDYKPKFAFSTFFNRNPQTKRDVPASQGGNDLADQKQDNEQEGPAWRKTQSNIKEHSAEGCVAGLEALVCLGHCFCH